MRAAGLSERKSTVIARTEDRSKNKIKIKGDGQECPSHMLRPTYSVPHGPSHIVRLHILSILWHSK